MLLCVAVWLFVNVDGVWCLVIVVYCNVLSVCRLVCAVRLWYAVVGSLSFVVVCCCWCCVMLLFVVVLMLFVVVCC